MSETATHGAMILAACRVLEGSLAKTTKEEEIRYQVTELEQVAQEHGRPAVVVALLSLAALGLEYQAEYNAMLSPDDGMTKQ